MNSNPFSVLGFLACFATSCQKQDTQITDMNFDQKARGDFLVSASIIDNKITIYIQSKFDEWILLDCRPTSFPISWLGKDESGQTSIIGSDRFGVNISAREQWTILPRGDEPNVLYPYRYTLERDLPAGFPVDSLRDIKVSLTLTYIRRSAVARSVNEPTPETQTVPIIFSEAKNSSSEKRPK